jgi:hypothetical protein
MKRIDAIGFFLHAPSSSVGGRWLFGKGCRFFRRGRSGCFRRRRRLWLDELDIFKGS